MGEIDKPISYHFAIEITFRLNLNTTNEVIEEFEQSANR